MATTTSSTGTEFSADEFASQVEGQKVPPGLGPWKLAGRRLRRNKVALFFGGLFLLIVVLCLLAPVYSSDVAHIGPNVQNILVAEGNSGGGSAVGDVVGLGISVGVVFKAGDGFRLMPEVGIMVPLIGVAGNSAGDSSANVGSSGFIWQLGLTFLFGSQQGEQR